LDTDTDIDIISVGAIRGDDTCSAFDFGEWRNSDAVSLGSEVSDKEIVAETEIKKEAGVTSCIRDIADDFYAACSFISLLQEGDGIVSDCKIDTACNKEAIKSREGIFGIRREGEVSEIGFEVVELIFFGAGEGDIIGGNAGEFFLVGV